jgi:hypothetical protein
VLPPATTISVPPENGWHVPPIKREPQLTVQVTIDGAEFASFTRDEVGFLGLFGGTGEPKRFATKEDAFDAAVKRRIAQARLE